MDMNSAILKEAHQIKEFNANIVAAMQNNNDEAFKKLAGSLSEMLMYYTYTQGHARRLMSGLTGEPIKIMSKADVNDVVVDPSNEKIKVRFYLQPDMQMLDQTAAPTQTYGTGMLRRVSGRTVEGYFSRIGSEVIQKSVIELGIYPFDFLEWVKDSTVKQNLEKEDNILYSGLYGLIRDCENNVGKGSSIVATTAAVYEEKPHYMWLDTYKTHSSTRKRRQPREFVITPDSLYLDFGKIPQTMINNMSQELIKGGFADKDATKLWDEKIMRVDDSSYLTCSADPSLSRYAAASGATFTAKEINRMKFFGYNVKNNAGVEAASLAELQTNLQANYPGLSYEFDLANEKASGFRRTLVLPPRSWFGKLMAWEADMLTNVEYKNRFCSVWSDEFVALLLHNRYAPTALDVWYPIDELK